MYAGETGHLRHELSRLARKATIRGADLVLQVPVLRDFAVTRILHRLGETYDENVPDRELLAHQRWFASHLEAFLRRLLNERPNAARAILRFLDTWMDDMHRRSLAALSSGVHPCTVVIEPTDRCNLKCPGCYAASTSHGSDLPYENVRDIVEQVIDMGVTLITISGGEPFLREREDRVITRLAEDFPNRGFLVYTNGTMIDEEIAERLGRLGNVFPAISVEGFEHQTDQRRGRGIYGQNRRVRRMLADNNVMTGFSATVTSANVDSICSDDFIDLRIEEGDLFGWFFILQPIGRQPRPDLMVNAEQRAMLREAVTRWRMQDRPIFLGDFWNDGPLVGGCIAAGRYYFHIYANGDISPCVFAPVACGNIFDILNGKSRYCSLAEFVEKNPVFQTYRAEQRKITDRSRPCLLIDHPEAFRHCLGHEECRPSRNMPEGYADGSIARHIDATAAEWKSYCLTRLEPLAVMQREYASASGAG